MRKFTLDSHFMHISTFESHIFYVKKIEIETQRRNVFSMKLPKVSSFTPHL